jgi:hypothetical protein
LLNTTSFDSIDPSLTSTPTTATNLKPMNDYLQWISGSIEKFSVNTFENIILKNNSDYVIHLTLADTNVDGYIKCDCKTNIKIGFRLGTNTFQLSPFFKHLKNSQCLTMKKKKQSLIKISNRIINSSDNLLQHKDNFNIDDDNDYDSEGFNNINDSFQIATNNPISIDSNSFREKRLSSSSSSGVTNKKTTLR